MDHVRDQRARVGEQGGLAHAVFEAPAEREERQAADGLRDESVDCAKAQPAFEPAVEQTQPSEDHDDRRRHQHEEVERVLQRAALQAGPARNGGRDTVGDQNREQRRVGHRIEQRALDRTRPEPDRLDQLLRLPEVREGRGERELGSRGERFEGQA